MGWATVPQRQLGQCLFVPCNCGHFCVNFHLQHFLTLWDIETVRCSFYRQICIFQIHIIFKFVGHTDYALLRRLKAQDGVRRRAIVIVLN